MIDHTVAHVHVLDVVQQVRDGVHVDQRDPAATRQTVRADGGQQGLPVVPSSSYSTLGCNAGQRLVHLTHGAIQLRGELNGGKGGVQSDE